MIVNIFDLSDQVRTPANDATRASGSAATSAIRALPNFRSHDQTLPTATAATHCSARSPSRNPDERQSPCPFSSARSAWDAGIWTRDRRSIGRSRTSVTGSTISVRCQPFRVSHRPQSSKSFNTKKQGAGTENTENKSVALHAVFERTPREAPKSLLLRVLRASSLLLRVNKLACLPQIERNTRIVIVHSAPAPRPDNTACTPQSLDRREPVSGPATAHDVVQRRRTALSPPAIPFARGNPCL